MLQPSKTKEFRELHAKRDIHVQKHPVIERLFADAGHCANGEDQSTTQIGEL